MTKILAFAGSSRKDSFNKKLVSIAAQGAEQDGATVTIIDLADFDIPIYSQDLEDKQGLPENAKKFKQLLTKHDGLLIASPEYNSAFSPLLKNVIDWASRAETENEPPLSAFNGKYAAIMSTSPGGLGGIRGLVFLRMLLGNIRITVLPEQHAVGKCYQAFTENGSLANEQQQQSILDLGKKLHQVLSQINT